MSTKQIPIYSFFLLAVLTVSLYFAFKVLEPFMDSIIVAIILASVIHPVHTRIKRMLGGRETLSALATTLLVTLLILVPLVLFTTALANQAANSTTAVQSWLKGKNLDAWLSADTLTPYIHWLQEKLPWLTIDLAKIDIKGYLLDISKSIGQFSIDFGTKMLSNFAGGFLHLLLLLFVLFFLLRHGELMLRRLKYLSPLRDAQEERILNRLRDVAHSVVIGSLFVAVCQGIVGGIGLAIVGIPALFWGAMMAFTSLVPVVGTMLIWGPAAIYLVIMGDWKWAIFIVFWGMVFVSGIDSILRPLVMRGKAQMSPFWVFLSIIGGIKYFGPLGILYGPLVLALAMVMLGIYAEEYSETLAEKDEPVNTIEESATRIVTQGDRNP